MNATTNRNVDPSPDARPAIVVLIERAYTEAGDRERLAAARWIEKTAWRFRDEDFEELLAGRVRLSDEDRRALREFRGRMIDERAPEEYEPMRVAA